MKYAVVINSYNGETVYGLGDTPTTALEDARQWADDLSSYRIEEVTDAQAQMIERSIVDWAIVSKPPDGI